MPVDRILGRVESIHRGEGRFSPTTTLDRVRCLFLAARYGARRLLRRWSTGRRRVTLEKR